MPFRCDAVIFDLDGVLIDSRAAIERHWRRWAQRHDIPFADIAPLYHGRPSVEVIREVAPHLDAETEARKKRDRDAADTEGIVPLNGARSLLAHLPDAQWTIATSGTRRTATARLSHVDLPVPDALVTADDVERGKPHPEPYELAAERLGRAPDACVVVEDAPVGITAAQRAGSPTIGVAATTEPAPLAEADVVVPHLASIRIAQRAEGDLLVDWNSTA